MMRFTAVIDLFPDVPGPELQTWVHRGWVRPEGTEPDWVFQDIDIARVRMIRDFRQAMAVSEETMPLVLSLLDQLYTTRSQIRALARAVETQPEPIRTAILAAIRG